MRYVTLFCLLLFSILSCGQIVPGSSPVIECLQPEGVFSTENKYTIEPLFGQNTELLLTSNSNYFLKAKEELKECAAHWQSEAVVVEIQGSDHDYFTVIILIHNKTFEAKFSWQSDGCETRPAKIIPTSASLALSGDDFRKGKKYFGHLTMSTTCNGEPCQGIKFNIDGNFVFTFP